MTNLEALRANISSVHGVVLKESHFVKALVDVGLNQDADYATGNERDIDIASIKLYDAILGGAGLSEGGVSYNYQLSGLVVAKKALEKKWGINQEEKDEDPKNKITGESVW